MNVLIMSQPSGPEKLVYFTSPQSKHWARLNVLKESIVVEHTVEEVETATFGPNERRRAINFIEALLFVYEE